MASTSTDTPAQREQHRGGFVDFVKRVITRFTEAQGPNWATIIAWNGMTAIVPIVLAIVAILGAVLQGHDPVGQEKIQNSLLSIFSDPGLRQSASKLFSLSKEAGGKLAIVSVIGFLWSGSGLIGSFDNGLNALYPSRARGFIGQKLMSFGMIVIFAVLTVALVGSSTLLADITGASFMPGFLRGGVAAWLLQFAAGALDCSVLFFAIFYVVPTRRQTIGEVLPGAIAGGVLLELFTLVIFPVYLKVTGGAAKEAQAGGFFFLLMFFMYVLGMISMLAAALNAERYPGRKPVDQAPMDDDPGRVLGAKLGMSQSPEASAGGGAGAGAKPQPGPHGDHDDARRAGVGVTILAAAATVVGVARERLRPRR